MKIEYIDEDNIIIFLNRYLIKDLDFDNKNNLEEYFKNLFIKLKDIYNIKISGYYELVLYIDNIYGIIIEIKKEDEEFYLNQIDMKLCLIETKFLYEMNDIPSYPFYKYDDKFYIDIENYKIEDIIEHSKIIYKDTDIIIKKGIKIAKEW